MSYLYRCIGYLYGRLQKYPNQLNNVGMDTSISRFSMQSMVTMRTSEIRHDLKDMLRKLSSCDSSSTGNEIISESKKRFLCFRYFALMGLPVIILTCIILYILSEDINYKYQLNNIKQSIDNLNYSSALSAILAEEMKATVDNMNDDAKVKRQNISVTRSRTNQFLLAMETWPFAVCSKWKALESKDTFVDYLEHYRREGNAFLEIETFQLLEDEFAACSMVLLQGDVNEEIFNSKWPRMTVIAHTLAASIRLQFIVKRLTLCNKMPEKRFHFSEMSLKSHLKLAGFFFKRNETEFNIESKDCHALYNNNSLIDDNASFCNYEYLEHEQERLKLTTTCFLHLKSDMLASLSQLSADTDVWIAIYTVCSISSLFLCLPKLYVMIRASVIIKRKILSSVRSVGDQLKDQSRTISSALEEIIPRPFANSVIDAGISNTPYYYKCATVLVLHVYDIWKYYVAGSDPNRMLIVINGILNLLDERISLYRIHFVQRTGFFYSLVTGLDNSAGTNQVTEMANLALDLLISCSDLEMGGQGNSKVELKIGLHSGPIIGAYIKDKQFGRFCILGETLQITSSLAKTCQPNSIHISNTAERALREVGFYDLQKRCRLSTASATKMDTYWLLGRKVSSVKENISKRTRSIREPLHLSKKAVYVFDPDDLYLPPPSYTFW